MNDKRRRITLTSVYAISHEKPKLVDNLDTSSRSSLSSSQCVMLYLKKKILNISATAYDWLAAIKGELRIARTYLWGKILVSFLEDWKQFFTLTLISPFTSQWLVRLPSRMAFHTKPKNKKTWTPWRLWSIANSFRLANGWSFLENTKCCVLICELILKSFFLLMLFYSSKIYFNL